jgi:hypothetical protein
LPHDTTYRLPLDQAVELDPERRGRSADRVPLRWLSEWPSRSMHRRLSAAVWRVVRKLAQPGDLPHRKAATAAPLDRFPYRQTLIASHRPQSLTSPPLSVPNQSIALTQRGEHRDR